MAPRLLQIDYLNAFIYFQIYMILFFSQKKGKKGIFNSIS